MPEIALQPFHLHAVDVAVVRRVVRGDGIEPDEVDAAIGERVVIGTEVLAIHAAVVERIRGIGMRPRADDPVVIMIARYRPHGRAKGLCFCRVQIEVRPRIRFGLAHGVAYEIAAHQDERRAERVRHSTKAAKAIDVLRGDVRVGRMHEGERPGLRLAHQPEINGRGRRRRRSPERAAGTKPVGH